MPLRRAKGEAPILSFAQERVWFLQHLEPTNPAYNRPLVMRLRGPLVFEALQSALLTIQQRHETLRAVFDIEAGKPTLRISDQALAKLELHDLSNLSGQAQRTALIQELQDRAHQVFSLRGEPIFRANLFRLADDDHVLSLVFHHLAFDRWSEEVFRNELGLLYQAHLHNQPSPLPQLEAHYADFAYWQRKWIESEAGQQQHQYWMSRLEGDLPGLELPIDARRPAQRSHTAATVFFDLSADLSRLVRGLSRRSNVTTHTTLMTALLVLLHRYSFQEDILIGIPTAGRMLPETEPMIGLFINTLAARHDLSGDPTVQELLQRVSRTTLADLSHQDYPFELVVQALNPTRDLRTTPLFQVLFNYENVPTRASSFESLQVEPFDYDPGLAQFDLTLEIEDRADHLACGLSFNQDIFQRSTIERIAGHYRTLLEGFVSDSQAHIADLPLLTQEEIPTLDMNRTDPAVPAVENLSAWFENQVDQTPTAVAVEFEGEMLTYAALNEQANRLAHLLIKQGVGPNHLVGLCFQPSLNMVVGIVAILKAGGAYVPLDPDFPDERLRFQLGDAAIDLVVSEGSHLSSIMTQSVSILAVDAQAEQIAAMSGENPQVNVGLGDLAYVLYTSGSTGEPKGVMITHGNVIHLLQVTQERCRFGPDDVWALFHSFTFDFSVWELFGALLHGGRLIVIPVSMRRSLDDFFTRVVFERLTVMSMIPPLFFEAARLPQFYDRLRGSKVRQIFLGGDELEAARLEPFFQGSGNAKIHITNIYGPTEATVFCTWHELSRLDLQETLGSVIGRPLDGVSSLVLDPNMNLLPAGAAGEIVIGGSGVAGGYLNRPELEREQFIKHPLDPRPGSRFYRTGDMGRMRADGELEFLGRQDAQLKIRGFRVEPGEIEAALQTHPAVDKAVVALADDGGQGQILAAYVVLEDKHSLQLSEMQAFLSEILPDYMIPNAIMEIESVPLTSIGKLDRKALPDLGPKRRSISTALVEPETELEKQLQSIWKQVLKVPDIGAHDNFFNLGGHSLMAMQLVARVREQLAVELNVQDVFGKGQTIAGMAEVIELRNWLTFTPSEGETEADQDQEQGRI